ncbi:Histone acetyltransferase type B subunit 2 [Spathaspora sp. JA1]|nr:Histone acetyltransferase type B subunit 2 [Spathaspora sp. JA1]
MTEFAKAQREIIQENQLQEKIINEEFKIWKKTIPLLYDLIDTFVLSTPTPIFKWVPLTTTSKDGKSITLKFLYSNKEQLDNNTYLKLASLNLPSTLIGGTAKLPTIEPNTSFQVLNKWKLTHDINKLKISPGGKLAISFNTEGIIHSYNLDTNTTVEYNYHKQQGYALDWISDAQFLSGANDCQVALWNIDKPSTPIQLFKSHTGAINDLSSSQELLFGSVSDDSTTQFHDIRTLDAAPVITVQNQHIQNSIKFHPNVNTLYATGGKDNTVNLYDLRKADVPFRKLYGHNDSISDLTWDVHNPLGLISSSLDRRIIYWNINKLNQEFDINKQKKKVVDPSLKFIHGGHTQRINDFDLHPSVKDLFASVGDDNLFEVWKPKSVAEEEESEEEEEQEEEKEEEQEEAQEEEAPAEAEQSEEKVEPEEEEEVKPESEDVKPEVEPKEEPVEDKEDVEMKD